MALHTTALQKNELPRGKPRGINRKNSIERRSKLRGIKPPNGGLKRRDSRTAIPVEPPKKELGHINEKSKNPLSQLPRVTYTRNIYKQTGMETITSSRAHLPVGETNG
jgi:hypothetical protein